MFPYNTFELLKLFESCVAKDNSSKVFSSPLDYTKLVLVGLNNPNDFREFFINLSSFRVDGDCGRVLRQFFTNIMEYEPSFRDYFVSNIKKIYDSVIKDLRDVNFVKNDYVFIFSDLDKVYNSKYLHFKRFFKSILELVGGCRIINIPFFTYLLNALSFCRDIDIDMDVLKNAVLDFEGIFVLPDNYDVYLFDEILGVKSVSLPYFIRKLIENEEVFFDKTPDLKIGVINIFGGSFNVDLDNFKYILEDIMNINCIYSYRPVFSRYWYEIDRDLINSISDVRRVFHEDVNIILSFDYYSYPYLELLGVNKPIVIGYLPNLIIRYMSKI